MTWEEGLCEWSEASRDKGGGGLVLLNDDVVPFFSLQGRASESIEGVLY